MKPTKRPSLWNSKEFAKRMRKIERMRRKTAGTKRENVINKKLKTLMEKYGSWLFERV